MKIQKTTNLEQFQFDGRNRNINRKHVKELADSILEYGQLQPIIVNTSMKVMEGEVHQKEHAHLSGGADELTPASMAYQRLDSLLRSKWERALPETAGSYRDVQAAQAVITGELLARQ